MSGESFDGTVKQEMSLEDHEDAPFYGDASVKHEDGSPLSQADSDASKRKYDTMTPAQHKYCLAIVRQLKRTKDSIPFRAPVDPVKQNIPDYPTIIKHPMDLGTIEKRLTGHIYNSAQEFIDDMRLMFSNCFTYNGTTSPVGVMGKNIETIFERQLKQLPSSNADLPPTKKTKRRGSTASSTSTAETRSRKLHSPAVSVPAPPVAVVNDTKSQRRKLSSQMRFCSTIIKELHKRQYSTFAYPFYQPVDPVACDCPDYFDIIKHPMDLSTVQKKLNNGEYETPSDFEADIRLIFNNCYTYNPVGTPVHEMGRKLEAVFDEKWLHRPSQDDTAAAATFSGTTTAYTPVAAPKQQSPSTTVADDEYEENASTDENYGNDKFAAVDKQISMLQNTLEAMKAKKSKQMRKTQRRRNSTEYGPITYAMQNELAERCNYLSADQLTHVAEILREAMPWLRDTDEIEIDVGNMEPAVFHSIYRYVCLAQPEKPAYRSPTPTQVYPATTTAPYAKPEKKKGRVLSEAEQAEKIRRLQEQLDRFSGKSRTSSPAPQTNAVSSQSDDLAPGSAAHPQMPPASPSGSTSSSEHDSESSDSA
ncbi:Swr1 complex bromodomain subunit Brf1 [Schizosaccharomyces japonicus yFS275]|uniref:Swr1 complex bromodomain subunit Brf1 n=1 Tax=Schizosaccharomyces japonicus (strain yFS275 / FY16936) TaxID=402676 RepID=B6K2N3_SCHJY|nr:Swr1 complex bromodomain subunit Brf1 [Schizosaccharomyces japonicus yFS275]EEB07414.2 Swr1 complex bromodomain subunit Brf1 [Schizosaccharomyces japonicus yFS275]